VASFFGDELVVGAFIHGFALFTVSYLIFKKTNNLILISVILLIIIGSFLIGERSNFLKLIVSITLFSALALKIKTHYKIYALVLIIISLGISLSLNEKMKYRYFYELESLFHKNGIEKYFKASQYGAHQNTAFNIFKDYPVFGVGIKNFRFESNKDKYFNKEYEHANVRSATHPHQTHLEFLSETGLFGYFSFLFLILYTLIKSINVYIKNRNVFQLSAIIFIFSIMIPLLPSGSFLSTFNSAIIWINFAIMIGLNKKLKF
jgi:O-antigen ligase